MAIISNAKKNKLFRTLRKASKIRYRMRLALGEVNNRHNMTPGLHREKALFEDRKKRNDARFNRIYDELVNGGVSKVEIEDRMWYNQELHGTFKSNR